MSDTSRDQDAGVQRLRSILPAPRASENLTDWTRFPAERVRTLPPDYRALVDALGPGTFDGFLRLHAPTAFQPFDLTYMIDYERLMIASIYDSSEQPYAADRLECWSSSINGDAIFWLRGKELGDVQKIVAWDGYDEWWEFDGNATTLLWGLLTRRVDCPLFPAADFFKGEPAFECLTASDAS